MGGVDIVDRGHLLFLCSSRGFGKGLEGHALQLWRAIIYLGFCRIDVWPLPEFRESFNFCRGTEAGSHSPA